MTWHTFFSLSTMQSRHLLAAYAVAVFLQGGYFLWVAVQSRKTESFAAKKINEAS